MTTKNKKKNTPTELSVAKIGISGTIISAFITLIGTFVTAYLGYLVVVKQVSTPSVEISSVSTPDDEILLHGTSMPIGVSPYFSIAVPGAAGWNVGLITTQIDRSEYLQTINPSEISEIGDLFSAYNDRITPTILRLILTGTPKLNGDVYIPNRVPIRVLSYTPITGDTDLYWFGGGGGERLWLFSANLSPEISERPDNIVWANFPSTIEYINSLKENIQSGRTNPAYLQDFPVEIQRLIESDEKEITFGQMPDYFTLKQNETLVFGLSLTFQKPGIYRTQVGVEYVRQGQKYLSWAEPPLDIYILPDTFYLWSPQYDSSLQYNKAYLSKVCNVSKTQELVCSSICEEVYQEGLKCNSTPFP